VAKIVLDEKPRFVNTQARRNVYSLQRAQGYNKSKIQIFEQVLENELFDENGMRRITAENIFNVDETGVCVNQKPHTILAKKGKKSISVIQSAEKGKTITAVCCVSATEVNCPPLMIFPRKRFKAELLDRGPIGAIGAACYRQRLDK